MKISMTAIIRKHLATLTDARTARMSPTDILIFYVVPVVVGVPLGLFVPSLVGSGATGGLSNGGLASFVAAIFVFWLRLKMRDEWVMPERIVKNTNELFANLVYSVLVALCGACVASVVPPVWWGRVLVAVIGTHCALVFMMCLKRFDLIFRELCTR